MRFFVAGLAAAFAAAGSAAPRSPATTPSCGSSLRDVQDVRRIDGARHLLVFASRPASWPLGRQLRVEVEVCPKGDVAPPDSIRFDATMPEHGHGMNYRASAAPIGPGRWRIEGVLLHMAGRWELVFELHSGTGTERLTHDLRLR